MDTIWNCAFGLDIDVQNQPNNDYFTKCEQVFSNSWKFNFPMYLGVFFHEFKAIIVDIMLFLANIFGPLMEKNLPGLWIRERIGEIVDKRNASNVFII